MQLAIQEPQIEQYFNYSQEEILQALKFIVDNNIKEYYRMVNEQGQTDLYILFLSQIQNNENVDDIINKDINAYNELAKTLNSKLLIYNKNFNNLIKLLLYLRHLSYKNAYNIN